MAITEEEIIAACEQIQKSGLDPTQQSIRELTGGSYSTIGPVLKKWKEQRQEDVRLRDVPVPDVVADASAVMTARLWEAAVEQATAGHDAMRRALLDAQTATLAERAEAAGIIGELESEAENMRGKLKSALARLEMFEVERKDNFRQVADAQVMAEGASAEAATLRTIIDTRDAADRRMHMRGVSLEKLVRSDDGRAEARSHSA